MLKRLRYNQPAVKPEPDTYVRPFPFRSPLVVPTAIASLGILDGKSVCDLGSAEGDVAVQFAKYANVVLGIECSLNRYRQSLGRKFIPILANWRLVLPPCDVYYIWGARPEDNAAAVRRVFDFQPNALMLVGGMQRSNPTYIDDVLDIWPGFLFEIPYHEVSAIPDDFADQGIWYVAILAKESSTLLQL